MTIARVGLVGMMLLTSLACGSSLDTHNSGTGGGAGVNTGQSGAGGSQGGLGGTTGTGGAPPVPPPSCLLDLIATCPLAGACQYSGENGGDQRFCFAGGETVTVVTSPSTSPNPTRVTEVRRSDGTLCYSIEMRCGTFCESYDYTWKDANGALVAQGNDFGITSANTRRTTATCQGTGETCNATVPTVDPLECVTQAVTAPTAALGCTQGSCP